MTPDERIEQLQEQIGQWQMVKDAVDDAKSPYRDRMVVRLVEKVDCFVATHRWEINPVNGFLTVQLKSGDILPTRLGNWCPYSYADDFFGIEKSRIEIDDL